MAQYVYTMNRVGKVVPPKRVILKDISLSFFPGAKIGVLGMNGSGKSSLLKIMAGEDREFEGEAVPMPNMRIGYLPQEPQLAPEQTVREAVELGMGNVLAAKKRLDEVYAEYAEPDADFDKLAASFGMRASRATTPEALRGELREAFKADGPALIEVPVGGFPDPWHLFFRKRIRG